MSEGGGEFALIARLMRPLTRGAKEALGLLDDVAVLPSRPGFDLIVTQDAMVEGVHFLSDDPRDGVAQRLVRTNLSDLAAKGAGPFGYFLTVAWPNGMPLAAKEAFASGLARDGDTFDLHLLGGDTVANNGPLVVSATFIGYVPAGQAVLRSGADVGDKLFVTGTLGDGLLGLKVALGLWSDPSGFLIERFRRPSPRLGLAAALRQYASACIDISDGLLADAQHLARASGVGVQLDLARLPLSQAARDWFDGQAEPAAAAMTLGTGGDDYELLIAVAPEKATQFTELVAGFGLRLTELGNVRSGNALEVCYGSTRLEPTQLGYQHGG